MFGKPEWFKKKTWGWGLVPITREGWAYTIAAAGLIAVPFNLLLFSRGVPEAMIWILATGGFLIWDVRQIMRAMDHPIAADEPFYIGDDDDGVQTRQLDLKLRR